MTAVDTAEAIADLVRRMDKAEGERDRYREMVDVAHKWADERVRALQVETARREQGLMNALWRALDREPGTERDLFETVRDLAAGSTSTVALALADRWEREQEEYPRTDEGTFAAAAVRCCVRELRTALAASPVPSGENQ